MTTYALNGLGRIGKLALKPLLDRGAEIAWINDAVGDPEMHAHLLEFDTVHGRWQADFAHDRDSVTIDGTRLPFVGTRDIGALPLEGVDVVIDQNTDDIDIAWLQGTLAATKDVYYSISTDNGSTWGTAVGPVNETAADDYRNLCSNGMVLSGDAGRYALSWVNDDTDDLMTNKVNSVSISAGGAVTTRRYSLSLTGVG